MISDSQKTFRLDLFRCSLNGILEVGFSVFAMLIAVRFLDAPQSYKSLLAAGSAIGFFIMPWTIKLSVYLNQPVTYFAGFLMLCCSLALFLSAFASSIFWYVVCLVFAQVTFSQMPGLMIHVYSSNYLSKKRGQNISWNFIFASLIGIIFSYFFGAFLDENGLMYYSLFLIMSGVALVCSITLFFIPSSRQLNVGAPRIFGGLSYVIKDSMFGKMLFGWMLMGLGVIMTIPLRIEYMAGKQGVGISNEQIAMIVILYSFAGIITSYWWGKLFDRMPFVPYRISLNLFLLFSVFVFFNSNSMIGLLIGSVLAGIANGGASIAWSLWVTKLAPVGLESEYMGAHVFMTGLRGFLAPFLGYAVLGQLGFQGVSYVSCGLILCSLIVFLTALKSKRL